MKIILTVTLLAPLLLIADSADQITKAAAYVDRALESGLKAQGLEPNPAISDETFVRRIHLDAIGRIPSLKEYRAFMASKEPNKRAKLIAQLVRSPGYASHQYNYWVDVLRARSREQNSEGENYLNYIRQAMKTNMKYDRFVGGMLTSKGSSYEHGNGAVGYYFRDRGMPLDNLSTGMQVFLGTDASCAQCHDDPFSDWTQMDYYQLAAFVSGINYNGKSNIFADLRKLPAYKKTQVDTQKRILIQRMINLSHRSELTGMGTGLIRLPHDYQYDDAKPHTIVDAYVPFGKPVKLKLSAPKAKPPVKLKNGRMRLPTPGKDIGTRVAFADWVTSRDNPMFTKTIANRMWTKLMGAPVAGDLANSSPSVTGPNKALTGTLIKLMRAVDYDLRAFQQILFNTKAYQRATIAADAKDGERTYFQGPLTTRLTAEQIWDSLIILRNEKIDEGQLLPQQVTDRMMAWERLKSMSPKEVVADIPDELDLWRNYFNRYSEACKERERELNGTSPKAAPLPTNRRDRRRALLERRNAAAYRRASTMPSPANASHFLREFGQSDRLLVDGNSTESSVPQALVLMNGAAEQLANNPSAAINRNLASAKTPQAKMRAAFASILSRSPKQSEFEQFEAFVNDDAGTADLVWILLNSNEFKFRQ